jgi:hypothetical protein
MSNIDLLVVQQHTVDGLDSRLGSLGAVIVDKAITLGASALVCCDLARKDVTEGGKSVMKSLGCKVRPNKSHGRHIGDLLPCCRSARQGS